MAKKGEGRVIDADSADNHLTYLMRLVPGEPIRSSTKEYYERNCKDRQETEFSDPVLGLIKTFYEAVSSGADIRMSYTNFNMNIKKQQEIATSRQAEMGAIGQAFNFLTLMSDRGLSAQGDSVKQFMLSQEKFATALQTMHVESIKAIKESATGQAVSDALGAFKVIIAANGDEIKRLREENEFLKNQNSELKENNLESHYAELNKMTELHEMSQELEDIKKEMEKKADEIREELMKNKEASEEDKEKFFLLRDSFVSDMDKVAGNVLSLGGKASEFMNVWSEIKGLFKGKPSATPEQKTETKTG